MEILETYELSEPFIGGATQEISHNQYFKFLAAKTYLRTIWDVEESFDLFARAFCEFEEYLLVTAFRSAVAFDRSQTIHEHYSEIRNNINLRLVAILTCFRGFDDVSCKRLSALQKESGVDLVTPFKEFLAEAYDSSFAYRFVCGLRHHSQHLRLPMAGFSAGLNGFWKDDAIRQDTPMRFRQTINPYLSVSDMLETADKAIKLKLKEEIRNLGVETIDIKFIFRCAASELFKAHMKFRKLSDADLNRSVTDLNTAELLLSNKKGSKAKFLKLVRRVGGEIRDEVSADPTYFASLQNIRVKWTGFNKLENVYVSSEIIGKRDGFPSSHPSVWIPD